MPTALIGRPVGKGRRRTERTAVQFSAIVEARLDEFRSLLGEALRKDDPAVVHDLRVCSRRLQQCLAAPYADGRPRSIRRGSRVLSRVRHALGVWRNCDVILERLERERRMGRSEAKHLARTRKRRLRAIAAARRDLRREDVGRVVRATRKLVADSRSRTDLPSMLHEGILRVWSDWREAFRMAAAARDVATMHALRIATKRLRYRVELVSDLSLTRTRHILARLKEIQDAIGRWHDAQLLIEATLQAQGTEGGRVRTRAAASVVDLLHFVRQHGESLFANRRF